ncbi:Protein-N(5)-glutamine methyltransferase PrmC, methylates polypeptide chain release factors RF1 and RF2 [Alkalibacterium sp. AK22]|uniref:peptide chain release factor N(5)-glutamine methyltransferase n=1 Tax=Alkalibacterium sp. AK22 TaxID=1229520 RepID=UPI0004481308|nr:peptide chain release factor N(5)-glutamine methyltransferase [Alkalibacterium sp. AK22]EXJ23503.1 Protein-N(5)-glutamine methyltransferase PrmC, methylates polypeptide chain release factors RF1 and RF2 [Alkalibacterium sp. AK22]
MQSNERVPASTYEEVLNRASSFLEDRGISSHLAQWVLKECNNWSLTDWMRIRKQNMPVEEQVSFEKAVQELSAGKPAQYVVGHEWFYGNKFKVTPDTLIPRPETEEWFARCLKTLSSRSLTVLDIGTGTGVLAVSHKLSRPQDKVLGVDISQGALEVAQSNAMALGADIDFILSDLTGSIDCKVDLVLSNPPYISEEEQEVMDWHVIEYEPGLALFAEENGLQVYRRLSAELPSIMSENGQIFLEIGYLQGEKVSSLFREVFPTSKIAIWRDISGNDRVVHIDINPKKEG